LNPGHRTRSRRAAQQLSDCKKRRLAHKGLCVAETGPACLLPVAGRALCTVLWKYVLTLQSPGNTVNQPGFERGAFSMVIKIRYRSV